MEPQTRSEVLRRLKSIEGHVRGVLHMVEAERPCPAILQQIQALEGSLRQVIALLLSQHLDVCLHELWGDKLNATQQQLRDDLLVLFTQKE